MIAGALVGSLYHQQRKADLRLPLSSLARSRKYAAGKISLNRSNGRYSYGEYVDLTKHATIQFYLLLIYSIQEAKRLSQSVMPDLERILA